MTFTRAAMGGTLLWLGLITLLHAALNWELFNSARPDEDARPKFKVGFLPVT